MHQISSSRTLIIRIFFTTFYLVFFGVGSIAFWLTDAEVIMVSNLMPFRVLFIILFLGGILVFRQTAWKLMRIDIDEEFVYVSNYFKTARYKFDYIEKIHEHKSLGRKTVRFDLTGEGVFGTQIRFMPDKIRYEKFFRNNPELVAKYN
ncbi:MAG TPA: hypothetical protein VK590_06380 [Saprospiraceae bacterium]|nr:hypothetical protein [Saprospiraceae bacterium]